MSIKTIIYFLLLITLPVFSQKEPDKKELLNNGMFFYEREDYKEAVYHFSRFYRIDKPNANIAYKIGDCYLNIYGQEARAIPYLEAAIEDVSADYNEFSLTETRAPLHAYYSLGKAYRMDNQIDKAIEIFYKFTKVPYFGAMYNEEMVEEEINVCKRAKILQDNPVNIKKINLGEGINDENPNFYPVVSGDEKTMVYVTSLKFYDAVYFVKNINKQWKKPEDITPQLYFSAEEWTEQGNITPEVGSDGKMYPTALSYDGTELYLVREAGNISNIYVSVYKDGRWSMAKALGKNVNERRSNETHACISHDGQKLYFSSDRRGGYGKLDIYVCEKEADGAWGKAINLGSTINTAKDDASPFITASGKTLFFISKGHYNMGEYDIFYAQKDENDHWKIPVNLGYPINTTRDDDFFQPIDGGKFGYMAFIDHDGSGNADIYKTALLFKPFEKVQPDVFPQSTVSFKIIDQSTQDSLIFQYNYKTGEIETPLPDGYDIYIK